MPLKLVPDVPEALREAAQAGSLVPFVGAGASCLAGCPNWNDLADKSIQYFVDARRFTHGQFAQVKQLPARIRMSIALALEQENQIEIDLRSLLHPKECVNPTGEP